MSAAIVWRLSVSGISDVLFLSLAAQTIAAESAAGMSQYFPLVGQSNACESAAGILQYFLLVAQSNAMESAAGIESAAGTVLHILFSALTNAEWVKFGSPNPLVDRRPGD